MPYFRGTVKLPLSFWGAWLIANLFAVLSPNPFETFLSLACLPLLVKLLWREGEPPVLFFALLVQWLQATIKVFYADMAGVPFADQGLHTYPEQIHTAFILSLIGVVVRSFGTHLAVRGIPPRSLEDTSSLLNGYNTRKVIIVYVLFSFFVQVVKAKVWAVPGLGQALIQLTQFKWALFFIVAVLVIKKNECKRIFLLILVLETVLSLVAYFSEFTRYFIFLIIAFFTLQGKMNPKQHLTAITTVLVFVALLFTWSCVKSEYRAYISGGERKQVVRVSNAAALSELFKSTRNISAGSLTEEIRRLVDRISYIDFFSACLEYIPAYMPHENGKVWKAAVVHIFTPRLFFPNKLALDDSEHLNNYTGLRVSGVKEGTSISLGYIGDSYIDFGRYFMFVPILLLGFYTGCIYRFLTTKSYNVLWGYALAMPLFYYSSFIEMSAVKTFGFLTTYLLVAFFVLMPLLPHFDRFIRGGAGQAGRGSEDRHNAC